MHQNGKNGVLGVLALVHVDQECNTEKENARAQAVAKEPPFSCKPAIAIHAVCVFVSRVEIIRITV